MSRSVCPLTDPSTREYGRYRDGVIDAFAMERTRAQAVSSRAVSPARGRWMRRFIESVHAVIHDWPCTCYAQADIILWHAAVLYDEMNAILPFAAQQDNRGIPTHVIMNRLLDAYVVEVHPIALADLMHQIAESYERRGPSWHVQGLIDNHSREWLPWTWLCYGENSQPSPGNRLYMRRRYALNLADLRGNVIVRGLSDAFLLGQFLCTLDLPLPKDALHLFLDSLLSGDDRHIGDLQTICRGEVIMDQIRERQMGIPPAPNTSPAAGPTQDPNIESTNSSGDVPPKTLPSTDTVEMSVELSALCLTDSDPDL